MDSSSLSTGIKFLSSMHLLHSCDHCSWTKAGVLFGEVVGILVFAYILFAAYYFATARSDKYPEWYPYQFCVNLLRRKDDNILHFLLDSYETAYKRTGRRTFSAPFPFMPTMIFINDPDQIEHTLKTAFEKYEKGHLFDERMREFLGQGIFNSDGEIWKHHRQTSVKLFNMNIFRGVVMYFFNYHMDEVLRQLKKSDGKAFDFQGLMYKFTLDSIGQIAFGHDIGSLKTSGSSTAFAQDFDYVQKCCAESFIDPLWYIKRHILPSGRQFFDSIKRLNTMAYGIIQERRKTEKDKRANGETLEDIQDIHETSAFVKYDLVSLYLSRQDENKPLSDDQLRDIILNFLIAGRDTTAQALSWSMYRLCTNPHIQKTIRDEVTSLLANATPCTSTDPKLRATALVDEKGWPTYHAIQSLKYLNAFCLEVLRLHPSVSKEGKIAVADDVLPDKTVVHKGEMMNFSAWVMGRTENNWKDCHSFKPERFLDNPKPSPFLFTAFLAGPRTCLGQSLALLEMKCCLARLLMNFEFTLEEDPSKVTYQNSLTHPILGGLQVSAREISK